MTCDVCDLPDPHNGHGHGIGSCDCPCCNCGAPMGSYLCTCPPDDEPEDDPDSYPPADYYEETNPR